MKHEKIKKRLIGVAVVLAAALVILGAAVLFQALSDRKGDSLSDLEALKLLEEHTGKTLQDTGTAIIFEEHSYSMRPNSGH